MKNNDKSKKPVLKKVVAASVVLGALAVGGIATSASFSDTGTTSVTVNSGTINMTLRGTDDATASKAANIDLGTMKPGDTFTKTIVVANAGTLPLKYTTNTTVTGDTALPGVITVKVDDTTGTSTNVLPAGTKLNAVNIATARTVNAGASQTLTLTGTWPNGTPAVDNPAQGKTSTAVITFNAVQ